MPSRFEVAAAEPSGECGSLTESTKTTDRRNLSAYVGSHLNGQGVRLHALFASAAPSGSACSSASSQPFRSGGASSTLGTGSRACSRASTPCEPRGGCASCRACNPCSACTCSPSGCSRTSGGRLSEDGAPATL